MGRDRYVVYEESTGPALWVQLLLLAALAWPGLWMVVSGLFGLVGGDPGAVERLASGFGMFALHLLFYVFFGVFRVRLTRTSLLLSFGWFPIISRLIAFDEIGSAEAVTCHPIRQFGGWGIRFGKGKRAWTMKGDRALRLELDDGTVFYVGSETPERLLERLRLASGRF